MDRRKQENKPVTVLETTPPVSDSRRYDVTTKGIEGVEVLYLEKRGYQVGYLWQNEAGQTILSYFEKDEIK